jgi:hypothetical protein
VCFSCATIDPKSRYRAAYDQAQLHQQHHRRDGGGERAVCDNGPRSVLAVSGSVGAPVSGLAASTGAISSWNSNSNQRAARIAWEASGFTTGAPS